MINVGMRTAYLLVTLCAIGCATQSRYVPVSHTSGRIQFRDLSVLPPKGENWLRDLEEPNGVVFGLEPKDPTHTFVVGAKRWKIAATDAGNPKALKKIVVQELQARSEGRWRNVKSDVSFPYRDRDTDCVHYNLIQEEHDNPYFPPGTVLIMTQQGFFCRDPFDATAIFEAGYSERYKQGDKSQIDDTLRRQSEDFLNDIKFALPS